MNLVLLLNFIVINYFAIYYNFMNNNNSGLCHAENWLDEIGVKTYRMYGKSKRFNSRFFFISCFINYILCFSNILKVTLLCLLQFLCLNSKFIFKVLDNYLIFFFIVKLQIIQFYMFIQVFLSINYKYHLQKYHFVIKFYLLHLICLHIQSIQMS